MAAYEEPGYYTKGKAVVLDWPEQDPVPTVTSLDPRPADAPEEPKAVGLLMKAARMHGFEVRVGYSLGQARAVKKGLYKTVHTYGVWARGHGWRWCAMYEWSPDLKTPWKWDRVAIWREDSTPVVLGLGTRFVDANVTDLKGWLEERPLAWFKEVHARVAEQAEAQRAKTKASPAKAKTKEGAS